MTKIEVKSTDLPGLYQTADQASLNSQSAYFTGLKWYLILLVCAAFVSYSIPNHVCGAVLSALLFLATLGILIFIRTKRPDEIWYNGRAVAESVKTRAWRWMMRADPYQEQQTDEVVAGNFINDLKAILEQNKSLSHALQSGCALSDPISQKMREVRALSAADRLALYIDQRVSDQAEWYWTKSGFNKRRADLWFWVSVILHSAAIILLVIRIGNLSLSFPIEVIATAAGSALTWLQAKKHNELNSAYALAAHEIVLIKCESALVSTEEQLSEYVVNSEAAFSREHTQWIARKSE
jgi:hypothetical protein